MAEAVQRSIEAVREEEADAVADFLEQIGHLHDIIDDPKRGNVRLVLCDHVSPDRYIDHSVSSVRIFSDAGFFVNLRYNDTAGNTGHWSFPTRERLLAFLKAELVDKDRAKAVSFALTDAEADERLRDRMAYDELTRSLKPAAPGPVDRPADAGGGMAGAIGEVLDGVEE